MATPGLSFIEENFGWTRKRSAWTLAAIALTIGILHIVYNTRGFLDEWDYWAGTFGLVVLALIETVLFVWVLGPNKMWDELHAGAQIRIPPIYKFVITYVTPLFLIIMMGWWFVQDALPTLLMADETPERQTVRWASRGLMLLILVLQVFLIRAAWKRRRAAGKEAI